MESRKKPTYICSTDLWQGSQKHTIGKGESLQRMLLGNWLSTHKNMKVNPQQGKQLSVPSHYGDKTVCHLWWQQCGHKGAIQVHCTVPSHVPTTCMDLEAIMLCEIRNRDNVRYHGISLISGAYDSKQLIIKRKCKQTQKYREETSDRVWGRGMK